MKTLYLECSMGAAGDMLMAALYELLEDKEGFLAAMNGLGLPGVCLEAVPASSCGIAGTHMKVTVHGQEETEPADGPGQDSAVHSHGHETHIHSHDNDGAHAHTHSHDNDDAHAYIHNHDNDDTHAHTHSHHHATQQHIVGLIDSLKLPETVKAHAKAVYTAIAEAEAKAHNCPVGEVHFHEVGAMDAVCDVTGVCLAVSLLAPEQILASPVHVGSGTVHCAHGVLPVPAPATQALLSGIPMYGGSIKGELCTPTGAALLSHFADSFGPLPVMAAEKCGYGLGSKVFEQANCVRAFWGETLTSDRKESCEGGANGEILELVCNIDDMTPEALAFACTRLLTLGALDVYTTAGQMKKGRSGHILTVLCNPEQEEEMARQILTQTSTNGLRVRRCGKYFLNPHSETVGTKYGSIRVKTAEGYGIVHRKAEYEDVAALAEKSSLPLSKIIAEAEKEIGKNRD